MNYKNEIDKITDELIRRKLVRHSIQFFSNKEGKMKPFGSGVCVKSENDYFIFTASHVTQNMSDDNQLFIRLGKNRFVSVIGCLRETDLAKSNNIDLSYIKIDERIINDLDGPYKFLPFSKIISHEKLLDSYQYCILGYPEKNIKYDKDGALRTGASSWYTKPLSIKAYKHYNCDPNLFYVLEMKGKGFDIQTGEIKKVNSHFYGTSGCGLWLLNYSQNENEISVDYKLIGIMTEFRKGKYYCLIGNKIKIIMEAISRFETIKIKNNQIP